MFGEHGSESPRVSSPWDPFLPSPPNESSFDEKRNVSCGIPKLVPEAEEGNVEYKLKLTHVSPARFARLVTQLKWRLLEGGGQAYYELGVADSGALIGLSRSDLEQSLETLEMMAGEIGASVIVVKEIEVPPAMYALVNAEARKYLDPETGEWAGKMKRKVVPYSEEDTTTTATETDTDVSATDFTDLDDGPSTSGLSTPADSLRTSPHPIRYEASSHRLNSHPHRPPAQSSPFIAALDDDLARFSMEPEPPFVDSSLEVTEAVTMPSFAVDLEIASVYKPRPTRRRTHAIQASTLSTNTAALHSKQDRRQKYKEKEKEKKIQPWHNPRGQHDGNREPALDTQEWKATQRRLARDRRRGEKRKPVQTERDSLQPVACTTDAKLDLLGPQARTADLAEEVTDDLVVKLETLHVGGVTRLSSHADRRVEPDGDKIASSDALASQLQANEGITPREPRLIVEALVVRKLSIEEAFLDFGGFQLV